MVAFLDRPPWGLIVTPCFGALALTDFPAWVGDGSRVTDSGVPMSALLSCTALWATAAHASVALVSRNLQHQIRPFRMLGAQCLGTIVLMFVFILLGASPTRLWRRTLLLAFLVASLTFPPLALIAAHRKLSHVYLELFQRRKSSSCPEICFCFPAVGAALGAWAGTCTLALDWNASWLQWPIPVLYGCWMGHVLGVCAVGLMWSHVQRQERGNPSPPRPPWGN